METPSESPSQRGQQRHPASPDEAELESLLRPAMLRLGDVVLSGVQQLRLTTMLRRISTVLSAGLGDDMSRRSIRFEILAGGADAGARDPAFGFVLASREAEVACIATLDRASARAMVDVIETQLADLKGTGEITPTEHGLLEFAVLSALDELESEGGGVLAVDRFLRRGELSNRSIFEGFDALDIRATIAGREGIGSIWFPKRAAPAVLSEKGFPLGQAEADTATDVSGYLQVMLALPRVTLSPEELGAVRPGDVIVIGSTDLSSFATDAAIVTSTAWRLADATIVRDGPDLVTVRCGPLRVEVFQPRADREGFACLVPVTGSHQISLDQVRAWTAGAILDLKKPAGANVDLLLDASWFASGELVRVEGEVGIRILEREDFGGGDPSSDDVVQSDGEGET